MRPNLSINVCGVPLSNPLVLASGILGTEALLMERVARSGAGAITAKSCGPGPRTGHPNPTVLDWGPGLINAVGLPNPGIDEAVSLLRAAGNRLQALSVPLIASIFANTVDDFARVAERVCDACPDLIEVNVSCPNVSVEMGRPFALDPEATGAVTRMVVNATDIPVLVKLSPNVVDIVEIARSAVEAGARGLTLINTLGPGMVIDVESGQPILSNRVGGVSGL